MADRYWVGGTDIWNVTAGTKWSTTSGGAGGAANPTTSDDVFFDANSGSSVVTISGTRQSRTLNCTGFTGTLQRASPTAVYTTDRLLVEGAGGQIITLSAAMTAGALSIRHNNGGDWSMSLAGKTLFAIDANVTNSGKLTLSADMEATNVLGLHALDTGGYNVKAGAIKLGGGAHTLSSSLIEVTGSDPAVSGFAYAFSVDGIATVTPGTSTIKFTASGSTQKTFYAPNKSFHDLWVATTGSGVFVVGLLTPTLNELRIDPGREVAFGAGRTTTVSSLVATGEPGNLITLRSTTPGEQWTLSKASGSVICDYLDIQDSIATGGATFDPGENSIDSGGNVGWWPPVPGNDRMFMMF